ncbi:class I SAM-dependent methyltransferase [uncultured Flavobacterium sp.]|uniref:class I SAM-dependent methyltransferase n=1 Tax=uncultured Flavobacterium sp. TaxID=165435 RepID=UPI0025DAC8E1|nr:class I SAM-dependent methyltransferase [uncultured Flavobacterium sp.]
MENKPPQLTDTQLQELASQLRCPDGEGGVKAGEMMNFTNGNMIAKAIESLNPAFADSVLEIGPGNGSHVKGIVDRDESITYTGIDISPLMVDEAKKLNAGLENISFQLADGGSIPFGEGRFDKVLTTNTIYFWQDAQGYANEIARVLAKDGTVTIGFIPESTMRHIPFAKYGFTLYTIEKVAALVEAAGLEVVSAVTEKEWVTSNSGTQIGREFVILNAKK